MKIEDDFEMVSFDVSNLFTNVPLDLTIKLILDKVYKKKMVKTKLKREELKSLLELCTKEMHFSFDGKLYKQVDGVCMGSPLGPVLANVFMVHLEESIAPKLKDIMPIWERYVDDTFTVVKKGEIQKVLTELNSFHPFIKFTHEIEKENKIAFLDVLMEKLPTKMIETSVYRKPTNNNIYIHWNAFGPKQWKTGTLAGIIRRAYDICSTEDKRKAELDFIFKVFTEINGYPKMLVKSMLEKMKDKFEGNDPNNESVETDDQETKVPVILKVPFRGDKGEYLLKKLRKNLERNLPDDLQFRIVHTGTKISKFFNIKDKLDPSHMSNFIYLHDCQNRKCDEGDYCGETSRRRTIRTGEHGGKDKKSHIFQHSSKTKHPRAKDENFKILATNYPDRRKRRLCEALFIRDLKPALNIQKESYSLKLFA